MGAVGGTEGKERGFAHVEPSTLRHEGHIHLYEMNLGVRLSEAHGFNDRGVASVTCGGSALTFSSLLLCQRRRMETRLSR